VQFSVCLFVTKNFVWYKLSYLSAYYATDFKTILFNNSVIQGI
jgi:hypothetical protein